MQDLTSVFSKVYPYPIFRPLLADFDFHQLGSHYIIFSIHGQCILLIHLSLPAPGLDFTSLLQSDSLKDSHNSPWKSACLHLIPSFLPLLSEVKLKELKRTMVRATEVNCNCANVKADRAATSCHFSLGTPSK